MEKNLRLIFLNKIPKGDIKKTYSNISKAKKINPVETKGKFR